MNDTAPTPPTERAVYALLTNEMARAMLARIILGEVRLSAEHSKRERTAIRHLIESHLIVEKDGELTVNVEGMRRHIAESSPVVAQGIDRFVKNGRVVFYPVSDENRREVLGWVAAHVLAVGERIAEKEITSRLSHHTDEPVLMRRYLIDYDIVERSVDGSWYQRKELTDDD